MSKRHFTICALLMGALFLTAAGDSGSVPVFDRYGVKRNSMDVALSEGLTVKNAAFVEGVNKSGTPCVLFEFIGEHGASYTLEINMAGSKVSMAITESSQFEGSFSKSLPMGTLGSHRQFSLSKSK